MTETNATKESNGAEQPTPDAVRQVLRYVVDPELQMNIVDLGLVYGVEVREDGKVVINMTLTSPGCPYGPTLLFQVRQAAVTLRGVKQVDVNLVWEPAWGPDKMSEDARLALGFDV